MEPDQTSTDQAMLARAARAAVRARGNVEPNPCVGCVIGLESQGQPPRVLAIAHHRRFGGPHAEVEALALCAARGLDTRGATAWVTLEPCNHQGKTGPCTDALLRAGIARVVCARRDLNPIAAGGLERLAAQGVRVELVEHCPQAHRLADPWAKRVATGLPWTIVKWAQTIDGRVAARNGNAQWISGPASRRAVHRLRGRVDAVITGIGTVLADDPLLTVRNVPARRTPRRVVIDSSLRIPIDCALVRTARHTPLLIATTASALERRNAHAQLLRDAGADIVALTDQHGRVGIEPLLRLLASTCNATNVLLEAGPALTGAVIKQDLADELLVFIAPRILGDPEALPPAHIGPAQAIAQGPAFRLERVRALAGDVVLRYRKNGP